MTEVHDHEQFVIGAINLDGASVGRRDNGDLVVSRPLDDGVTAVGDMVDLAHSVGFRVADAVVDTETGEVRLVVDAGGADE